ncbi:MAG: tyrosine-type recombinase/integrase [Acidipila sp.]|nr:tyrosine-type recombinase/integrase [Acidipila sp.]
MSYKRSKGHNPGLNGEPKRGGVKGKPEKYKFLTEEQVSALLNAIASDTDNRNRARDHCAMFCCFYFALRVSECAILDRESFQWLADNKVDLQTLKQRREKGAQGLPRRSPPQVEASAVLYVTEYLKRMHPRQKFLFTSHNIARHVSSRTLDRVFNTYAEKIGLSIHYSSHAMRHARGVYIYEMFKDVLMVKGMLRHSSLKSSEVYLHLSPSTLAENQRKLDERSITVNPIK